MNVIFAVIGSGLHCWPILMFSYAYTLIFRHCRFGSLFWLLGVLIGTLFHKKWVLKSPYLKARGSYLVLEAVLKCSAILILQDLEGASPGIYGGDQSRDIFRGGPVKTLPKAQRTRELSSYQKITVHKSLSYYNFRISIKH